MVCQLGLFMVVKNAKQGSNQVKSTDLRHGINGFIQVEYLDVSGLATTLLPRASLVGANRLRCPEACWQETAPGS